MSTTRPPATRPPRGPTPRGRPTRPRPDRPGGGGRAWAAVLADREYRGLLAGYAPTLAGDQLARVAVCLLVFQTTDSPAAAAGAYALTLLPALVGGPLLSGLADRHPRRTVMIGCDLAAAGLTAAMAAPGLPVPAVCGLLFAVGLAGSPFGAARAALVRDLFPDDDRYAVATTISSLTFRAAQVLGSAAGGLLVAGLGARPAMLIDSATFLLSAAAVRLAVAGRPAANTVPHPGHRAELAAGWRLVVGDRQLRRLACYAWLAAFHAAPFAVVVPLAARRHGGPVAVGLLLAADTAGTALCLLVLTVAVPDPQRRLRLLTPLSVLAAAPLIGCAADPGLGWTALLWALSGVGVGYQLAANIAFVTAVPAHRRAQAFGLVSTGLLAGQGGAVLLAGTLAQTVNPALVVAGSGLAGTLAAVALGRASRAQVWASATRVHASGRRIG